MFGVPEITTTAYAIDFVLGGGDQQFTGITITGCQKSKFTVSMTMRGGALTAPVYSDLTDPFNPIIGYNSPTFDANEAGTV